jgi:6-methylsalicylic acid synthase
MVAYVEEVHILGEPPVLADIDITKDEARDDTVHVLIADQSGHVVARLKGLRYATVDRDRLSARNPAHLVGELVWRPLAPSPGDAARQPVAPRPVAVIGPDADALATLLSAEGAILADPSEFREPTDVLLLPPVSGESVGDAAAQASWRIISAIQRFATSPVRLWCLTAGVPESAAESHLAYSPIWGICRVAASEHPSHWGGVIDVPPGGLASSADARLLLRILRAAPKEDVIALREGKATVPRLVRPTPARGTKPLECRPDATYLITGGLGALGLEVADWLADRGARHVVLAGRKAATDEAAGRIRSLERRGVIVRAVSLDIADAAQAARILSPDALGLPPVRGVVHAAGVLDSRLIAGTDEQSLRTVLRPKVDGAWVLHDLFPPGSLDFFVLFSSCGHLLGLPGQAAYGAANAFLDALAAHRRASGDVETLSLGWTSWRGKGMSVNEIVDMELAARGVTDISAAEAFAAWDLAAAGGGYQAVLGLTGLPPGASRLPLLSELPMEGDTADRETPEPEGQTDLGPEEVLKVVASVVAAEMKLPVEQLDPRRPLAEQGLDSVMTIVVRRRLEKRFTCSIPADLLWNQPTVTGIAEHLAELLAARHNAENTEL